jgi:hypothetical protein
VVDAHEPYHLRGVQRPHRVWSCQPQPGLPVFRARAASPSLVRIIRCTSAPRARTHEDLPGQYDADLGPVISPPLPSSCSPSRGRCACTSRGYQDVDLSGELLGGHSWLARWRRITVARDAFISRATALIDAPSDSLCRAFCRCSPSRRGLRPKSLPSARARAWPDRVRSIRRSARIVPLPRSRPSSSC